MNTHEATTETTPETKPGSRGVERKSLLDRLRRSKAGRFMAGVAVVSTIFLAGCGEGDGQVNAEKRGDREAAAANSNILGSDARQEVMMEEATLSFAKTILEYMADGDTAASEKIYLNDFTRLGDGGWSLTNAGPQDTYATAADPQVEVSFLEAQEPNPLLEESTPDPAILKFFVLQGGQTEWRTDDRTIEFNLEIKEGQEGKIPVPNSSNPSDIKKFAEWFGSNEAADILEARSVASVIDLSVQAEENGSWIFLVNGSDGPDALYGGDGVGNFATDVTEPQPMSNDALAGELDKTRTRLNQALS